MNKGFIFLPLDGQDSFGPKKNNNNRKKYRNNKNKKNNKNYKPRYHQKNKDNRNKSKYDTNNYEPNTNIYLNSTSKNRNKTYPDRYDIDLVVSKDNPFKFDFSKKNNSTQGIIDIDISKLNPDDKKETKDTKDTKDTNKEKSGKKDPQSSILNNDNSNDSFSFFLPIENDISLKKPDNNNLFSFLLPQFNTDNKLKEVNNNNKLEEIKKYREGLVSGESIDYKITDLNSLINLSNDEKYKDSEINYNIDLKSLYRMKSSLIELQNLIGMDDIKDKIFLQVLFYLQGLDASNQDLLHTVIEGSPGVGKTELAKILGNIYKSLGILSKGTFTIAKRSDLIGSFLGSTAMKTGKILNESKGGVLFIDEAYSLGNEEGKDIYSKECIDTINQFLSENREDFVCIIAGYKDALKNCFFKYNAGLERRFPWRYSINKYNAEELSQILTKIVNDNTWKIDVPVSFFEKHLDKFKYFGGDMEILFHKTKLAHSKRSLLLPKDEKKVINNQDIEKGLELFLEDREKKQENIYMLYS